MICDCANSTARPKELCSVGTRTQKYDDRPTYADGTSSGAVVNETTGEVILRSLPTNVFGLPQVCINHTWAGAIKPVHVASDAVAPLPPATAQFVCLASFSQEESSEEGNRASTILAASSLEDCGSASTFSDCSDDKTTANTDCHGRLAVSRYDSDGKASRVSVADVYKHSNHITHRFSCEDLDGLDTSRNIKAMQDMEVCKRIIFESIHSKSQFSRKLSFVGRATHLATASHKSDSSFDLVASHSPVSAAALGWRRMFVIAIRWLLPPALTTLVWATWPFEDPLVDPKMWWHILALPFPLVVLLSATCNQGISFAGLTYNFEMFKYGNVALTTVTSYFVSVVVWILIEWLWTKAFGLNPPLPWFGFLIQPVMDAVQQVCIFYAIPSAVRQNPGFKKRAADMGKATSAASLVMLAYYALIIGFVHVKGLAQLCLVPVWVMIRESFTFYSFRLAEEAGFHGELCVFLFLHSFGCTMSGLMMSVVVASFAEDLSQYCLIFFDALTNVFLLVRSLQNWSSEEEERQQAGLRGLMVVTLNETREIILALSYLAAYFPLYYGPNAKVMGLVKATAWHFAESPDIMDVAKNVLFLVAADAALFIATLLLVKLRYGINLLEMWVFIENRIGLLMALFASLMQLGFFNLNSLYSGMDMTFKVNWIHG